MTDDLTCRIVKDLDQRMVLGMERYGVPLYPFNGRSAMRDAYEELMDLALYLRQVIQEATGDHRQPLPEIGHLVIEDVLRGWEAVDRRDTISVIYQDVLRLLFQLRAEMS